jgi:trimeric autotransporter adhesin
MCHNETYLTILKNSLLYVDSFTMLKAIGLMLIFYCHSSHAADYRKIVYQGRILRPDTSPVVGNVQFRFLITDSAGTCVLWEETQSKILTDGAFSVLIGSATPSFDGTGSNNVANVFKQGVALNCKGGVPTATITAASNDDRNISLSFNDGSGWNDLPTQLPLKAVPYALTAENAVSLGGFALSATTPTNGQGMIYNSVSNQWEPQNLTGGGTITSVVAGTGLTGGATSGIATLNVDLNSVLPSQTGQSGKVLSTNGSGTLSWAQGLTAIGNNTFLATTSGSPALPVATTLSTFLDSASSNVQGSILYRNSSGWVALPPGSSGQYLRANGTGANPSWSVVVGGGGLAQVTTQANLPNGKIWVGDNTNIAQVQTLSQDVSIDNTGVATINKIQNRLVDSTNIAGGLMTWDTATSTWKGKAFPSCTTAEAPYFNSVGDNIQCQTVAAAWASVAGKPTTLSGYGITDAVTGTGTAGTIPKLSATATIADSIITENASKIGIGQALPDTRLHVAGTIKIGDGSETCTVTGNGGMIRYNSNNIQYCDGANWQTLGISGSGLMSLTGDVSASGSGSVSATVTSVSGVTAANVASGANAANAATSNSTVSTIASRDSSGVTSFKGIKIDGSTSGTLTINTPAAVTSYNMTFPNAAAGVANSVLASDTSGNLSWISLGSAAGNISLSSQVTGTLPIANGGTNSSTTLNNSRIMVSSGGAIVEASALTNGQLLVGSTGAAPVAASLTGTANQISVATGAGSITLSTPQNIHTSASPTFTGITLSGLTTAGIVKNSVAGVLSGGNSISLTADVTGTLPIANGGTGVMTLAANSVLTTNSSGAFTASSGSTGQIMTMNAGAPVWTTASYPETTTINQILFSSANNTVTGLATANNSVLVTNGSGVPAWSTATTDNFTQYALLAGRAGGQTITGGTAASNNLTLESTSNATKGNIILHSGTNGNVGVGTTNPGAKLEVVGAIRSVASDAGAATTLDWNLGNVIYTTTGCSSTAYTMNNLRDGASYTLIIKATSHSAACAFTGSGVTSWRFYPTASLPTGHVVLTILKAGNDAYISWVDGY